MWINIGVTGVDVIDNGIRGVSFLFWNASRSSFFKRHHLYISYIKVLNLYSTTSTIGILGIDELIEKVFIPGSVSGII